MAAMQAAHPDKDIHDEVSDDCIVEEITTTFNGINLILEKENWTPFVICNNSECSRLILELAGKIDLKKFKKHKHGVTPSLPKDEHKGKPHLSTARLLYLCN